LQVVKAEEYSEMAKKSRTVSFETTPRRGTIYDRNGVVLAVSIDATTIYANPSEIVEPHQTALALAAVLGGDVNTYKDKLSSGSNTFAYIKRQADVEEANRVKELGLKGIYFIADTRREYPQGEVGGQIVGFCDADGKGITGLELYYDDILSGEKGIYIAERGADGRPIVGGVMVETPPTDGTDITISLDIALQSYVEETLKRNAELRNATGGVITVMDSATGEFYASTSLPLFDPSDVANNYIGSDQLKVVTQILEPGSVFKTIAALSLLDNGFKDSDSIFCPVTITADEYTVSDSTKRDAMDMTLREVIRRSSNVGISLFVESMGFEKFYDTIVSYGFGKRIGVDYPGEAAGTVQNFDRWGRIIGYNNTFGQGISVTPLQIIRVYAALRNGGYAVTPHFLLKESAASEKITYDKTMLIESQNTRDTMISMLETVVSDGTGKTADINGFTVAGKTSTAEIAELGVYKEDVYNMSFVGFLPESNSSLVCYVGLYEVAYEVTVGSMFADIMNYAITQYRITEN
ncbi:MAG: penicillin-binding protein 2, partial [Eggerthellaceae bacterium]|nr:penicillin-binding protein 2 [Eggerthellaceae bacterium]